MVCLGVKYGCDAVRDAPALLSTARHLGLQVVGVSFHVGSGCRDPLAYRAAVRAARGVFDVAAELGIRMTLLDIGGGYPGDNEPVFVQVEKQAWEGEVVEAVTARCRRMAKLYRTVTREIPLGTLSGLYF